MTLNEQFAEDVLSYISETPILLSDIIAGLRLSIRGGGNPPPSGRRWRNVRWQDVCEVLEDFGAHFAYREHGPGTAEYVAAVPFTEVPNPKAFYQKPQTLPVISRGHRSPCRMW